MILGVLGGRKTDDEVTRVSCALAKLNNEKLKKIVEWILAIMLIATAASVFLYNT